MAKLVWGSSLGIGLAYYMLQRRDFSPLRYRTEKWVEVHSSRMKTHPVFVRIIYFLQRLLVLLAILVIIIHEVFFDIAHRDIQFISVS